MYSSPHNYIYIAYIKKTFRASNFLNMKKVLVADDHSIVRLGASIVLKKLYSKVEIFNAENYDEVLYNLKAEDFELILLDINMPGGNNINTIKEILVIQPNIKILVFSSYDESLYALRYIEAGAAGFLNKNSEMSELQNAIESIELRGKYMSDHIKDMYIQKITQGKAAITKQNQLSKLSNREMDVAKHLVLGQGISDVSEKMNLSPSTISTYKSRIFEKLNIENLPELIELFRLNSLV